MNISVTRVFLFIHVFMVLGPTLASIMLQAGYTYWSSQPHFIEGFLIKSHKNDWRRWKNATVFLEMVPLDCGAPGNCLIHLYPKLALQHSLIILGEQISWAGGYCIQSQKSEQFLFILSSQITARDLEDSDCFNVIDELWQRGLRPVTCRFEFFTPQYSTIHLLEITLYRMQMSFSCDCFVMECAGTAYSHLFKLKKIKIITFNNAMQFLNFI